MTNTQNVTKRAMEMASLIIELDEVTSPIMNIPKIDITSLRYNTMTKGSEQAEYDKKY